MSTETIAERELRKSNSGFVTDQINDTNHKTGQFIRKSVLECLARISDKLTAMEAEVKAELKLDATLKLAKFYMKGGNAFACVTDNVKRTTHGGGSSDWDTQLLVNPFLPFPIRDRVYGEIEDIISEEFSVTSKTLGEFSLFGHKNADIYKSDKNLPDDKKPTEHPNAKDFDYNRYINEKWQALPGSTAGEKLVVKSAQVKRVSYNHAKTGLYLSQKDSIPNATAPIPLPSGLGAARPLHPLKDIVGFPAPGIMLNDVIGPFNLHRLGYVFSHKNANGEAINKKGILGELIDITIPRKNSVEAFQAWNEIEHQEIQIVSVPVSVAIGGGEITKIDALTNQTLPVIKVTQPVSKTQISSSEFKLPSPGLKYHFHEACTMIAEIALNKSESIHKTYKRTKRFKTLYDGTVDDNMAKILSADDTITGGKYSTDLKNELIKVLEKFTGLTMKKLKAVKLQGHENDYIDAAVIKRYDPFVNYANDDTLKIIKQYMVHLVSTNLDLMVVKEWNTAVAGMLKVNLGPNNDLQANDVHLTDFVNAIIDNGFSGLNLAPTKKTKLCEEIVEVVKNTFDRWGKGNSTVMPLADQKTYTQNIAAAFCADRIHTMKPKESFDCTEDDWDIYHKALLGKTKNNLLASYKADLASWKLQTKISNAIEKLVKYNLSVFTEYDSSDLALLDHINAYGDVLKKADIPKTGLKFHRTVVIPDGALITDFMEFFTRNTKAKTYIDYHIASEKFTISDTIGSKITCNIVYTNKKTGKIEGVLSVTNRLINNLVSLRPIGRFHSKDKTLSTTITTGLLPLASLAIQRKTLSAMIHEFRLKDIFREQYRAIKLLINTNDLS